MNAICNLPSVPFATPEDITIGVENEWQVCVKGEQDCIDLVQTIRASHHYKDLCDRTTSGDIPRIRLQELDHWLEHNPEGIWENSWVRIPCSRLAVSVKDVFENDLRKERSSPDSPRRNDADRFFLDINGKPCIRVPVSYMLKLSLHQHLASRPFPKLVQNFGLKIAECFSSDNTSPEISSFYPAPYQCDGAPGQPIAEETMRRYLLTQWLASYANQYMGVEELGQHVLVYASPHPPLRQQVLNTMIPDSFYRELFISPCLSGWENGEAKFHYMNLCHKTLARSQINAVHKMKEAGIIQNNLVILPSLSHTGLSNNGLHISVGSRSLSENVKSSSCAFGVEDEKNYGDLVTKIVEHFVPLFVGTYSAAPWKLDFADFHPERILGFLPHELSATHLRMLWRRWKKKGRFKVLGRPLTPFGPVWLDRAISRVLRFKGDFVPDFRLLDYPVALSSTSQSPALDGSVGNEQRLLYDMAEQGVFDATMPLYRLWRLREVSKMGYSGFEARFYSLMPDTACDMPHAVALQVLLTSFAYQMAKHDHVTHDDIPDTVRTESERRNIFFSVAAGLPTFYIKRDNPAPFMQRLIACTPRVRNSRRYPGYWRVEVQAYQIMLIAYLREHAAECIHDLKATDTLHDLEQRLRPDSAKNACARITMAIQERIGKRSIPGCMASECNLAAENHYRTTIRQQEINRALDLLEKDIVSIETSEDSAARSMVREIFPNRLPSQLWPTLRERLAAGKLTRRAWHQWMQLLLLIIREQARLATDSSTLDPTENQIPSTGLNI